MRCEDLYSKIIINYQQLFVDIERNPGKRRWRLFS